MRDIVWSELADAWDAQSIHAQDQSTRVTLRACADAIRLLLDSPIGAIDRERDELLQAACAIAIRKGAETSWERFEASLRKIGIRGITARHYLVLPSDPKPAEEK